MGEGREKCKKKATSSQLLGANDALCSDSKDLGRQEGAPVSFFPSDDSAPNGSHGQRFVNKLGHHTLPRRSANQS
ncbi:hypothetical protein BaRGS_00011788, partial [Batillaria attramentaria]